MKRITALIALTALFLSACGDGEAALSTDISEILSETEISSDTQSESISETTAETTAKTETETATETESETIAVTESESSDTAEDYKTLYKNILMQCLDEQTLRYAFDLFDIDSDGTPELIISNGLSHMATADIYTITDGEAVRLENSTACEGLFEDGGFGSSGLALVSEKGYILCSVYGQGLAVNEYYSLENGKLTHLLSAEHNEWYEDSGGEYGEYEYGIDGKGVTEAEYNEAVSEFEKIEWTKAGRKYTLDKGTINSVLGEGTDDPASESESNSDYKALYKAKLAELRETEEYEPSISSFDLYDIDNDGTPELFVAHGNYHAAMATIYTVHDGEVKKLCDPALGDEYSGFGSWGMAQVAEGGYISSCYFGMGSGYADYYHFENGELTHLLSSEHHMYFPDESGEEQEKFVIDGDEVSEEEYNEAVREYEAMDWTDVGQGYRFFDIDEAEKVIDDYGE